MKRVLHLFIALSLLFSPGMAFAKDKPEKSDDKPMKVKSKEELFKLRDADCDGKVTEEEFIKGKKELDKAKKRFVKLDKDKDGSLDLDEFRQTK